MGGCVKTQVLRLDGLSDDALLARVDEIVARGRRVEAELVWHLAEVDRRRLYLREACPSMHVYATSRLQLSDAEAYLRITVARVSRRFPVVLPMLADGRLHLSAIAKLAPHLREDGGEALLERAAHRSRRAIEALVAEIAPRPDVPPRMRRLPAASAADPDALRPDGVRNRGVASQPDPVDRCAAVGGPTPPAAERPAPAPPAAVLAPDSPPTGSVPLPMLLPASVSSVSPDSATRAAEAEGSNGRAAAGENENRSMPTGRRGGANGVLAAIAPSRYRVQFTAGDELRGKIARAQALLRRQVPDGDLAAIVDRAMTLLVRELERARFAATTSPRVHARDADPAPSSRRIPDPIRRAVWTRDGEQSTFRDRKGRRCQARERLEFHHLIPFARGGHHSESNLTLRCAGHNAHQADLDFGAAFMAARRRAGPASSHDRAQPGDSG